MRGTSVPEKQPPPLSVLRAEPPAERADAARNRRRVLEAAASLFAERGVDAVSMDDVVAAAGVGKGTLYRRFGDKSGLATALLDERERELQARILSGPAPLGPGAEPPARLAAFVSAYVDYVAANLDIVAASQQSSPGARLRTGSHRFWRAHLVHLFRSAGTPQAETRADVLLAALTAEQVTWWTRGQQRSVRALRRDLQAVAASLMTPA
jgi:AcrR family transcriptional regulator